MFAIRETNQKTSAASLYKKQSDKSIKLSEFGEAQFRIFEELLELAEPNVVVIANAAASEIYQWIRRESLAFDNENGYHLDRIGQREVPVFFTSMLTGQRALDLGSRRRLFWHLARALGVKTVESPKIESP